MIRRFLGAACTRRDGVPRRFCGAVQMSAAASEVAVPVTAAAQAAAPPKKLRGMRRFIADHGLYFALHYWIFNEICVLFVTFLLHDGHLAVGDIENFLEYVGLSNYIDVDSHLGRTFHIGSFEISGRLLANFGIASAFMSLWTPLQIPFCVWTFPLFKKALIAGKGIRSLGKWY